MAVLAQPLKIVLSCFFKNNLSVPAAAGGAAFSRGRMTGWERALQPFPPQSVVGHVNQCVFLLPFFFVLKTMGSTVQDKNAEVQNSAPSDPDKSHSNHSLLLERRLSDSSFCSIEEQHRAVYEMVQQVFLSTRGYINFVNEVFRQVSVGCMQLILGGGGYTCGANVLDYFVISTNMALFVKTMECRRSFR